MVEVQTFRGKSEKDSSYGFSFPWLTAAEQSGDGSGILQWGTQGEWTDVRDDN